MKEASEAGDVFLHFSSMILTHSPNGRERIQNAYNMLFYAITLTGINHLLNKAGTQTFL